MSAFKSADQLLSVKFSSEPNAVLALGHAMAIDTDGYFLTAAHCLDSRINYLVYSDGESARIAIPRVVAKISGPTKEFDLPIIHVDTKLRHVFALASSGEYHAGCSVVGGGTSQAQLFSPTLTNWGVLKNVCFAGQELSVSHSQDRMVPAGTLTFGAADLQPGINSPAAYVQEIRADIGQPMRFRVVGTSALT